MADVVIGNFPDEAIDLVVSGEGQTGVYSKSGSGGTIVTPPATGDGSETLTLEINRNSAVSPASFQLRAIAENFASTNNPYQDLAYHWTIQDAGQWKRMPANMPWPGDKNYAYGPRLAHTFEVPAVEFNGADSVTRTITCLASDGVVSVSASIDVTIENPDVRYSGTRTICVSQDGNFSGAPAGCQTFTDPQAAIDEFTSRSVTRRVLFRRGEDFSIRSGNSLYCNELMIGGFGNTNSPPPNLSDGIEISFRHTGDLVVFGLDLQGNYDPTVPTGIDQSKGLYIRGQIKDAHTTVHDVGSTGFGMCFAPETGRENIVLSDCFATNWYDFALFQADVGNIALVACNFVQNPLAKNLNGKYNTAYANHGSCRLSRCVNGGITVRYVDAHAFNDWSMLPNKSHTVQPPFRLNNGGYRNVPEICVTQSRSGGSILGLPATNSYSDTLPVRAVFDKCYHIGFGETGVIGAAGFAKTVFKNCIFVKPDNDWAQDKFFSVNFGYAGGAVMAASFEEFVGPDEFIQWVGCTVLNFGRADLIGTEQPSWWTPIINGSNDANSPYELPWGGNVRHPNASTTHNLLQHIPAWGQNQPLDMTSTFDPYPVGKREGELPLDTSFAVGPEFAPLARPTQVIPADGTEKLPPDDFFGAWRSATPSKGADEPVKT